MAKFICIDCEGLYDMKEANIIHRFALYGTNVPVYLCDSCFYGDKKVKKAMKKVTQ